METGKKIWFTGYTSRLWIPVSIEGWGLTAAMVLSLFLIFKMNNFSDEIPFSFAEHWPTLLELVGVAIAFYWVSRGHVNKKYK